MKKILLFVCILFSLRVNAFSLTFPRDVFQKSSLHTDFAIQEDGKLGDPWGYAFFLVAAAGVVCVVGSGIVYMWANTAGFTDYPYSDPKYNDYIVHGTLEALRPEFPASQFDCNYSRFSLGTSLVYLNDFGIGNETQFEGFFFSYIGPFLENLALYDFNKGSQDFDSKGFRDNIKLGGQISVLQSNILSASFVAQASAWYGNGLPESKCENFMGWGCNLGGFFRSYPIKPLVLEYKFGWQLYSHGFRVFESDLHLGVMLKRFEIFASWKVLDFSNYSEKEHYKRYDGASLGTRIYFSPY